MQTAKEDTTKINILNKLSWENYLVPDYDTALNYAGKAKVLAENLRFQKGTEAAYNNIGNVYDSQGNYPEALKSDFAVRIFVFSSNKKLSVEKQKSENLLLNILPGEIVAELKTKGSAAAKQFDEVSILFTDFVNFTQAAEQLRPEQLVQALHECFTAFDNIIERNGLEKIKTIGDAYLAVCGLPAADPQHARKTVQAALEIRDFIEERKQSANVIASVTKQSDNGVWRMGGCLEYMGM